MRYVERTQTRVIALEGSVEEFEQKLNATLKALAEEERDVTIKYVEHPNLIAIITYTDKYKIATNLEDAYHLDGIFPKCKECRNFVAFDDKRLCRGKCKLQTELVRKDQLACEVYYKELERAEEEKRAKKKIIAG